MKVISKTYHNLFSTNQSNYLMDVLYVIYAIDFDTYNLHIMVFDHFNNKVYNYYYVANIFVAFC